MSIHKTLQELTLKDNFMFSAVMSDPQNCRELLELILDFPIGRIEVQREKSIVYNPRYKGVRLDIYACDGNNTRYNVEMQSVCRIKESREMEERFMTLNELLRDERREGLAEGLTQGICLSILEVLSALESVPQSLADRIRSQKDPEVLRQWLALAVSTGSLEEFQERI